MKVCGTFLLRSSLLWFVGVKHFFWVWFLLEMFYSLLTILGLVVCDLFYASQAVEMLTNMYQFTVMNIPEVYSPEVYPPVITIFFIIYIFDYWSSLL